MPTFDAFNKTLTAAGWEKVADMGTHTHKFTNNNGVEFNVGLNDEEDAAKLDAEVVDTRKSLSVLLSIEPSDENTFASALQTFTSKAPGVTAETIMQFAEQLGKVCDAYAEPSQVTVDAGYQYDEGSEDWIKLGSK